MINDFTLSDFNLLYPDDLACLDAIKKIKYGKLIFCPKCKKQKQHYKINKRMAYSCKACRNQVHPLSGTIFAKSSTPLKKWFYAIFLMTHTRAGITARQLQKELEVTYKTAWRMYSLLYGLMQLNKNDLLIEPVEKVFKWTFLNKLELKVVHKQEDSLA